MFQGYFQLSSASYTGHLCNWNHSRQWYIIPTIMLSAGHDRKFHGTV
jgi:hypothetical protein